MDAMNDIVKELRASINLDAVHGDMQERIVCANQMERAAAEIERLRRRLHDYETRCDPPSELRDLVALRENNVALQAEIERLREDVR